MVQATDLKPFTCSNSVESVGFLEDTANFANIFFGYLDQERRVSPKSCESDDYNDDEDDRTSCKAEESKKFWETQNQLLQETLHRTNSFETKVRQATKEAVRDITLLGLNCTCRKRAIDICRDCLRREISIRLQAEGFNCAICKSKWKGSHGVPSGEHTYLEVVSLVNSSKKGQVRVVIALNFRAEFEMARANEDYSRLVNRLPEVFVGKAERLNELVKILCSAAKVCMKEKQIYLAPWRKQKYMQSKWLGTCEKTTLKSPLSFRRFSDQLVKTKTSMLTYDLSETTPLVFNRTADKVL
ncbi:hypothetical protein K2173_013697 [Erythroxylum novogranatense]|uniref:Uncharacterized protein n=1 Tax=Erythroxylum novogranatense TaxID=1862640 RepID=A0AAV8SAN0_9ROSI|nr:hypothetical protein K2173_013697 [Erythroxylum novogranatense]